jgi:hypothetical protein
MPSSNPHAELPIGTRVRILMGRGKLVGTVKGWRFADSAHTLERRVLVERTDGQIKCYLPRSLQVLPEKPSCAP